MESRCGECGDSKNHGRKKARPHQGLANFGPESGSKQDLLWIDPKTVGLFRIRTPKEMDLPIYRNSHM